MKVIILAGGLPSTLIEEDEKLPKPMAEIGGRPLLWHIMKQYAHYGHTDFVICTGYKGEIIKDYFMNFYIYQSDITVDLQTNEVAIHRKQTEDWKVSVIDTGRDSSVLKRLCMAGDYTGGEPVLVAYGDCLSDIDIEQLVHQHESSGAIATLVVAHPTGRNEILTLDADGCYQGTKKSASDLRPDAWVNACSMVLEPEALKILQQTERTRTDGSVLDCLAMNGSVATYRHAGFWSPVETIRDKVWLEGLWSKGLAPWKVWED